MQLPVKLDEFIPNKKAFRSRTNRSTRALAYPVMQCEQSGGRGLGIPAGVYIGENYCDWKTPLYIFELSTDIP